MPAVQRRSQRTSAQVADIPDEEVRRARLDVPGPLRPVDHHGCCSAAIIEAVAQRRRSEILEDNKELREILLFAADARCLPCLRIFPHVGREVDIGQASTSRSNDREITDDQVATRALNRMTTSVARGSFVAEDPQEVQPSSLA
ncbi:hypothetical protein GQF56_21245 [Rhodobacter sphaeroides]|uniref:hypothetical protein n=1 Tax=Cereibacter sphaeroides TaxID=1063 RepID=UPI0011BE63E1|nr:hypothetical protein [Cereibacter sphaeroides]MVX50217.1 hypothetical protein [Cereibacter sphaeroides]MVX50351.1 hypothetical protein [Cereibacter sphaeroides]QJC86840.1 hypothetical protein HGN32_21915 [Cereibacter sphaeroides]